MKSAILAITLVLLALPAAAGTLTITTSAPGTVAYSLNASQNALINLWVQKLNDDKCVQATLTAGCTQAQINALAPPPAITLHTSVAQWLLSGPLTETLQSVKANVESTRVTNIFNPAVAGQVASTPQCTSVGLSAGCLNSAIRDSICGALGLQAGCSPR